MKPGNRRVKLDQAAPFGNHLPVLAIVQVADQHVELLFCQHDAIT